MSAQLALGSVQFGLRYGVANQSGQVGRDEARVILGSARAAGVDMVDTAIGYGDSETVLGQVGMDGWNVVTKLPACPADCADVDAWARGELEASGRRLGIANFYGVLLHRPMQLLEPVGKALQRALLALRQEGVTQRIGVSVYAPGELEALADFRPFDLVQLPFNVLDARWTAGGWLEQLRREGTEIHARSAFLQGLLLMQAGKRPDYFARWQPLWQAWHAWLDGTGLTALQVCLRHALAAPGISRVVVGVDSLAQWREILAAADGPAAVVPASLPTLDAALLNPASWNLN